MNKTYIATSLTAMLICANAHATTLTEALVNTYNTNPSLQAARASLRAIDENVAIAKSGYRPNIYLQGSYGQGSSDFNGDSPDQDVTQKSASAVVSQSLFSGLQTVNSVKAADKRSLAGQSDLLQTEQGILLSAATAYLDVLQNAAIVKLQYSNEDLLHKKLEETIERFNVGEVTRTDVSQAKARYSRAKSDRISAQGNLEASKSTYIQIIGMEPKLLSEPKDVKKMLPKDLSEALLISKNKNHLLQGAKLSFDAADYTAKSQTGALLPELNANASVSKSENEYDSGISRDSEVDNWQWSLNMKIPLYSSGQTRAKIRQAKYNKWQAQENVLSAERSVEANTRSAWEYMVANDSQILAIKDEVKANEIALDGVQKEEALGNRTVLDVLDAYQELLSSKVEEVKARRNYYVSAYSLLMAMGKLTASDLSLQVDIYDAKKLYEDTRDKIFTTSIK